MNKLMDIKFKIGLGVVILALILTFSVSGYFFLLACVGLVYVIYLLVTDDNKDIVENEATFKKDGEDVNWETQVSTEVAYEYLMRSNFTLRMVGENVRKVDVTKFESLIDDLRRVVLKMEDSSSVLKWKVNQICSDFLPKLVNRFVDAPATTRGEIMDSTVKEIHANVLHIDQTINTNKQEDFAHYANTLQKIMKV